MASTEPLGWRLRRSPLGSSGHGIAFARPTSPAAVLSHAAVERLSGSFDDGRGFGFGLSKSASAPLLPPAHGHARLLPRAEDRILKNKSAFDRRLARDFCEADPELSHSISPNSSTTSGFRCSSSPERHAMGLSLASRRENFRKDRLEARFQSTRGEDPGGGSPVAASPDVALTAEDVGVVKPEAFLADIAALQGQFADLERNLRLEHMTESGQADRLKAERDAERRRREEQVRRARKKEQEARDPKKKVALRIENKRAFEKDKIENDANIPMTTVDVGGGAKGHEHIPLVDVRMMVSKCVFTEPGLHVSQMIECMAARERQEAAMNYSGPGSHSSSRGSLKAGTVKPRAKPRLSHIAHRPAPPEAVAAPAAVSTATSRAASSQGTRSPKVISDMRRENAGDIKEITHVNGLLKKIKGMRNNLNYSLPYKFEVHRHQNLLQEGELSEHLRIAPPACYNHVPPNKAKEQDRKVAEMLTSHFVPDSDDDLDFEDDALSALKIRRAATQQVTLASIAGEAGANLVGLSLDRRKEAEARRLRKMQSETDVSAEEVRKRVRRRWAIVRAIVQWMNVLKFCRDHNSSMDIIKGIAIQLGEWARMKRAIHKFHDTIVLMQRTAKNFVALKKKRCAVIDRDWSRVEDHALQSYFRELGLRARMNYSGDSGALVGPAPKRKLPKKATEESTFLPNDQERSYDWRTYRIPAKTRIAAISRFYMNNLRKKTQQEKAFLETVKVAVNAERELVHFLKDFGATDESIQEMDSGVTLAVEPVPAQEFWHCTEEMMLQMIAVAAQSLRHDNHWRFHPANIDFPEHRERLRGHPKKTIFGTEGPVYLGRFAPAGFKRRSSPQFVVRGAPEAPSGKGGGTEGEVKGRRGDRTDVDEVLERLSPRLREIAEEIREQPAGSAPDPSVPVADGNTAAADASAKNESMVLGFVNHGQMLIGAQAAIAAAHA